MFSVYACKKLGLGETPKDEKEVAHGFETAGAAMDAANKMAKADRTKTYLVGESS